MGSDRPDGGPSGRDPSLDRVVVVTFRKSFWASSECEVFPHRVYGRVVAGHSTNVLNTVALAVRAVPSLLRHRPRVIVFGSAHRLVPFALLLRRLGLLRSRIIVTNQVYFGPKWGRFADRVIVYSRAETAGRPNYVYLPLPADGDFAGVHPLAPAEREPYVFAGGGTLRDFPSLIEALRGTGVQLVIVTHTPETLDADGVPNVEIRGTVPLQEFLTLMSGARLVVVPLQATDSPHGHTTVAQALCLGKAVVTTEGASVEDYVHHGVEGLLVPPGDVEGYRSAAMRLLEDDALRLACEQRALGRAPEFSYSRFADALRELCREVAST